MKSTVTSTMHVTHGISEAELKGIVSGASYVAQGLAIGNAVVGYVSVAAGHSKATVSNPQVVSIHPSGAGHEITASFDVDHGIDNDTLKAFLDAPAYTEMWEGIWNALAGKVATDAGHAPVKLSKLTVVGIV